MTANTPVKSVKKALDLLNILTFDDLGRTGIALTELARRTAMPINTVHNLLKTMAVCGYVAHTPTGTYCTGPRVRDIGRLNLMINASAAPGLRRRLEALCEDVGEAVTLTTLANGRRILLCEAAPQQTIRVDASILQTKHLLAIPTGRVLAAFATDEDLERILEQNGMPGATWSGIASRKALQTALAEIRRQRLVVINPDGNELVSFAVPVLDESGQLLGALGCYAPRFRCGPEKHKTLLAKLHQTAVQLAEFL